MSMSGDRAGDGVVLKDTPWTPALSSLERHYWKNFKIDGTLHSVTQ